MDNLGRCLAVNFFSGVSLPALFDAGWLPLFSLDPPTTVTSSGDGVIQTEGNGGTAVRLSDRTFIDPVGVAFG